MSAVCECRYGREANDSGVDMTVDDIINMKKIAQKQQRKSIKARSWADLYFCYFLDMTTVRIAVHPAFREAARCSGWKHPSHCCLRLPAGYFGVSIWWLKLELFLKSSPQVGSPGS